MRSAAEPGSFRAQLPFHVVWLATNLCNARCLHCSSNSATRLPDELTTEEALKLMEDFADAGVIDVAFSGGEPLLRADLLRIACHARRLGIAVGVGTNGSPITRRVAEELAAAGVNRVQVSLDGLPESHDTLRCWPGLYERALKAIDTAKSAGLRVHACCTINRLNFCELEAFVDLVAGQVPVSRLNLSRYVPTGRGNEDLDLSPSEWKEVILLCARLRRQHRGTLDIVTHLAQTILVDEEVSPLPGFIGCQAGRGQGCVTADGTVLPCVLLPIPIGNVRERSFRALWMDSSVIRNLQDRECLYGPCGSCEWRARCGGCRAVAVAHGGDYLSSDPRCWLPGACTENQRSEKQLWLNREHTINR